MGKEKFVVRIFVFSKINTLFTKFYYHYISKIDSNYHGFVTDVVDVGDASYECMHCRAMVWFGERVGRNKATRKPKFSLCCMKGKVCLPYVEEPPTLLLNLLHGLDSRSKHFLENIRAYNSMFSFTSIGGRVESAVNNGGGPPQFVFSGQNYHRIGSLVPDPGRAPKFAQLYIHDTQNELKNRMKPFE